MEIGTQLLSRPEADGPGAFPDYPSSLSDAEGTVLAIVPIPGTGTSLAIIGYSVDNGTLPGVLGGDNARDAGQQPSAGLVLDHDQRRAWADGAEISLTYQEFELLAFLSAHPATVFSRSDLVARVWQRDFGADSRTVDVHISRLRRKLGPRYGRYLVTEYRVGYQFRPSAAA